MSILVIAEKPSVARVLAKVLSCPEKGDGFLRGKNYIVSWAIGHLVGLADPDEYSSSYKKWSLQYLPIIPDSIKLKILPGTKKQFTVLKKLMNSGEVTEIICATDSGREGELIFRYIYEVASCKKPFRRLWISSMTDSAIKKGFENLKNGNDYDNLYKSARCRSEADWLVGINASRAYSVRHGALLTLGRVQTPTLSLLVAKKKEIEAFKPEKYWEVAAVFDLSEEASYKGVWFDADTKESKITSADAAKNIVSAIKGKSGLITDIINETKKVPHPLLFDLTELQRECNRKFGLSAKKTLESAQSLYEKHKVITYPRTDSRYLTDDMAVGIRKVLNCVEGPHAELAKYPLSLPALPITKRIVDNSKVTDHHAIIPTGKKPSKLSDIEFKIYDLIVRRLIAAFYPEYTYSVTKVTTVSEKESFLTKGISVINPGWTTVLGSEQKDEAAALPIIAVNDTVKVHSAKVIQKTTSPPKQYTDATLLSAMENAGRFVEDEALKEQLKESGLGTPATRAAIIERLIDVGYAQREKKTIAATEKGVKIIDIVPDELKSPETTAKWERALNLISNGKMDTLRFNKSIQNYVRYIVEQSKNSSLEIVFESENNRSARSLKGRQANTYGKCPLCGKNVLKNSKAFYCEGWRDGCVFKIWQNALEKSGAVLDENTVKKLLKESKIENFPVLLSSTREKGVCTLSLDPRTDGYLNIINFKREEG